MALVGTIQNKRPGAGVYVGAGVAKGGQQGRSNVITQGVGGAKMGGATYKASAPKPGGSSMVKPGAVGSWHTPSATPNAAPTAVAAKPQYGYVTRGGKKVLVQTGAMTPAEKAARAGGASGGVGAGSPAAAQQGVADETGTFRDGDYFLQRTDLQNGLANDLSPLQAELAKLNTVTNGKTLYDSMYDDFNNNFQQQVSTSRDDATKSGLLRSGAYNKVAGDLATGFDSGKLDLRNKYGDLRIGDLNNQITSRNNTFTSQLAALGFASADALRQRQRAANAGIYGQTILPGGGS